MIRLGKPALALLALTAVSCGRESTPTGPSGPTSFLAGTWPELVNDIETPRATKLESR